MVYTNKKLTDSNHNLWPPSSTHDEKKVIITAGASKTISLFSFDFLFSFTSVVICLAQQVLFLMPSMGNRLQVLIKFGDMLFNLLRFWDSNSEAVGNIEYYYSQVNSKLES